MTVTTDTKTLLKSADPPLKNFVAALVSENLKLQRQIAKYQAENISLKHKVTALEEKLKKKAKMSPFEEALIRAQGTSIPIKSS